jgi:uncharacterized protein
VIAERLPSSGSDYPQYSLKDAVDALERLDLNEAEKDKIRYGNARRLFFSGAK